MAVTYVTLPQVNPRDTLAPKKYYARAKARGEITLKQLCKEIAEGSTTVSDTDVLAVLNDLIKVLRRHLGNGFIVRFGDFGSFQVSISSEGADSEETFHISKIRRSTVAFRPGADIQEMLKNAKYEKIK